MRVTTVDANEKVLLGRAVWRHEQQRAQPAQPSL